MPKMTIEARKNEHQILTQKLETFNIDKQSTLLHITGVPGSGKTYTVKETLKNKKYVYINCNKIKNKRLIFNEIKKQITEINKIKTKAKSKVSRKNNKTKVDDYEALKKYLSSQNKTIILVLDEVDLLDTKNQDILYSLVNLPFHDNIALFLITISNSFHLETKIASRIGDNTLIFQPYRADQLIEILDEKKNENTKTKTYIARRVAAVSGDARRAINWYQDCKDVDCVEAEKQIKNKNCSLATFYLKNLPFYHKLFLYCDFKNKNINDCFIDFCGAIKLREFEEINFLSFIKIYNQLIEIGVLKKSKEKITYYLIREEIDEILKDDKTYRSFIIN